MKKQVKAKISTKRLIELAQEDMKLPKNAKACYHYIETWSDSLVIMFEHESFAAIPEEDLIPIWEPPTTECVNDKALLKAEFEEKCNRMIDDAIYKTYQPPPEIAPGLGPLPEKPPKKKKWREFL